MGQTLLLIAAYILRFVVGAMSFVKIGQSEIWVCLQRGDLKQMSSREQERAAQSNRWAMPARESHQ